MIYFIAFILTLLFSHIARATPACGDVPSPEELYRDDPTYADAQHALPIILYNVTWSDKYDNKEGNTKDVACSNLAHLFPHFKNIPPFPYIGAAWNVKSGSEYCGSCWNLTDLKTRKTISITVIDSTKTGYKISKEAFHTLNGGKSGSWLQAEAKEVSTPHCGWNR